MTLEEAIVEYREKAKYFKTTTNVAYGLKLDQLSDWLEELSRRRVEDLFRKADEKAIRDKAIDDFADRISEYLGVENATKYGNKNADQQKNSYDTLMKYEIADAIEDVKEQLKAGVGNEK